MSTFSYDPNLPNPDDDPADDVDQMKVNSTSISSLIDIDHIGFNVAGGGWHDQVTFPSNNVPTLPTTNGILFSNTQSPVPGTFNGNQVYYYPSGAAAAQSSAQYNSTSTSGSTMLFGGIILKWGTGTHVGSSGGDTISFQGAFPNACFLVVAVSNDTSSATSADTYIYPRSWTTTGFNLLSTRRITLASENSSYSYIAIGN